MQQDAAAKCVKMVIQMSINLAVLLDELIPMGGELQIKRVSARIGSNWELILWQKRPGENKSFPVAQIRLRADTSHALVRVLEGELDAIANPQPEPEPAKAPYRVGDQLPLVI